MNFWCLLFGHAKGLTPEGLEILPVGGHINRLYNCGPLWPIIIKDDQVYPDGLFDSYSQEIFTCPRCGKQLVHHL